jgi:hypothetical protein
MPASVALISTPIARTPERFNPGIVETRMPNYTIQVGNKNIICESPNVVLADDQEACVYAIQFASDLFRSQYELCSGQWHLCSIHVLADGDEQVFETTMARAALIERDLMRYRKGSANN